VELWNRYHTVKDGNRDCLHPLIRILLKHGLSIMTEMNKCLITDMKRVIEQVSRDKGIEFNVLVKALEEALRSAAKKKFGNKIDIEIQYNDETGELEVFQFKEVVEEVTEPDFPD
jgi:hypothetical protein